MNKAVTLEDVALRAGVSRQTVSRAINGKAEIRPETRERVMAAIEELGYRPNVFARGLVRGRSQTVGLIVGDLTNPFFPDVTRGVMDDAELHDYVVLVCNLGQGWDTLKPLGALASRGVDGYIVFPAVVDREKINDFAEVYGPIVVVDAPFEHPSILRVILDWQGGAWRAAEHLAAIDRRRPCILDAKTEHASRDRTLAFRDRAAQLGLHIPNASIIQEEMTIAGGQYAIHAMMDAGAQFDSVFAFNDLMAIGAMRALAQRGVDVPGDCAVIGCDDIELAANVTPSLTSVAVGRHQLGVAAMTLLRQHIDEPTTQSAGVTVGTTLTIRSSTVRSQTDD